MWTVPPIIMSFDSILLFTVADFQVIHLEDVANSVQSLKPPADGHALTSLEIHDALESAAYDDRPEVSLHLSVSCLAQTSAVPTQSPPLPPAGLG